MIFWMNLINLFCSLCMVSRCSFLCYWVAMLLWHSNSTFRPNAHLLGLVVLIAPIPFKTALRHHTTSPPLHTLHRLGPYAPGQQSQLLRRLPMAFLTAQSSLLQKVSTTPWGNWYPNAAAKLTYSGIPYGQAAFTALWDNAKLLSLQTG